MVGEYCPQVKSLGVKHDFVGQSAEGRVAVDYVDALPDKNVADERECREDRRKSALVVDDPYRQVINFETVGHIPDARPVLIGVGYDNDFVAQLDQTLRQLVYVTLDATRVRVEEVGGHTGGHENEIRTDIT